MFYVEYVSFEITDIMKTSRYFMTLKLLKHASCNNTAVIFISLTGFTYWLSWKPAKNLNMEYMSTQPCVHTFFFLQ